MTRRALLATATLRAATPDWQSHLVRSITHDEENFEQLRRYVFEVHDLSLAARQMRESQSYEINLFGPGMYLRKLTHNDLPLSPADAALEQTRLRTHLSQPQSSNAQAPLRKECECLQLGNQIEIPNQCATVSCLPHFRPLVRSRQRFLQTNAIQPQTASDWTALAPLFTRPRQLGDIPADTTLTCSKFRKFTSESQLLTDPK